MRVLSWLLLIGGIWFGSAPQNAHAQAAAQAQADDASPPIAKWIGDLESDIYSVRVRATERLILAGAAAIEPLTRAVEQGELETISRGVYVLRHLALSASDAATEAQAYEALTQLAERRFSGAARRAATALLAVNEMRHQRAQERLTQLGAVFAVVPVRIAMAVQDSFPAVQFGPQWRGGPADFAQVAWITSQPSESASTKWMISIESQPVSDEWIDHLTKLENVAVVKFRSVQLPDRALKKLAAMPDLEILELLYTSVSDADVEHLAALPKIARLRLIGTDMTSDGRDRLQQQLAHVDIDFRNGGFLGVGCTDNPCRISLVQPDTAAAKAGLRTDDVIIGYNGHPVQTMDELTRQIAQNTVGDKVTLEVQRQNERITVEIELGAWD